MNIPYLLLLDMDKILNYDNDKNQFNTKGDEYNPLKNDEIKERENYYYGDYRVLLKARKTIKGIVNKKKFVPGFKSFSIQDKMYEKLVWYLKNYCIIYNVYPVNTTIEGSLVNLKNYEIFYQWILSDDSHYPSKDKLREVYEKNDYPHYKVDILKHVIDGKTQLLSSIKAEHINKYINQDIREGYLMAIDLPKIGKSSGWVSNFLEYYFKGVGKEKKNHFQRSFPELDDIIKVLDIKMK